MAAFQLVISPISGTCEGFKVVEGTVEWINERGSVYLWWIFALSMEFFKQQPRHVVIYSRIVIQKVLDVSTS